MATELRARGPFIPLWGGSPHTHAPYGPPSPGPEPPHLLPGLCWPTQPQRKGHQQGAGCSWENKGAQDAAPGAGAGPRDAASPAPGREGVPGSKHRRISNVIMNGTDRRLLRAGERQTRAQIRPHWPRSVTPTSTRPRQPSSASDAAGGSGLQGGRGGGPHPGPGRHGMHTAHAAPHDHTDLHPSTYSPTHSHTYLHTSHTITRPPTHPHPLMHYRSRAHTHAHALTYSRTLPCGHTLTAVALLLTGTRGALSSLCCPRPTLTRRDGRGPRGS